MTAAVIALPLPAASGLTNQPSPPPDLPDVEDAKQFYLGWGRRYVAKFAKAYWPLSARHTDWDQLVDVLATELQELISLRPGWDGGRANSITSKAVYGAVLVLSALLDAESEPPQFFPLPSGGIHLEWLVGGDEVEIDIDDRGAANVLAESASGEVIADGPLDPMQQTGTAAEIAKFLAALSADLKTLARQ